MVINNIKKCIKYWENIRDRVGYDRGSNDFPLCIDYFKFNCYKCPIKRYTGASNCINTPYREWIHHWFTTHTNFDSIKDTDIINVEVLCIKCQNIAQEMINFLKGILKTEEFNE